MRRYLHALLRLLPPGIAWRVQHATAIRVALQALADEMERVDARAAAWAAPWRSPALVLA